jgi:phosphoglycolate phosphatase-like HAD superfamily hydrolase
MNEKLRLSPLPKTWILDLDGTLVKHNGYLLDGKDTLLPGVKEVFSQFGPEDMVLIVTSRDRRYQDITETFLQEQHIRYNAIIYNAPYGERIVVNDSKPSGLVMARAVPVQRDQGVSFSFEVDRDL